MTVWYDSAIFGSKQCGTYSLHNGVYDGTTAHPLDQLDGPDQATLGRCLNNGEKINTVKVRWNVPGFCFLCLNRPAPKLNGMELVPAPYASQPQLPETKSCDDKKPGVQFIFGGDSHVYVADGELELCAGAPVDNSSKSQQIALVEVPAIHSMRPGTPLLHR